MDVGLTFGPKQLRFVFDNLYLYFTRQRQQLWISPLSLFLGM